MTIKLDEKSKLFVKKSVRTFVSPFSATIVHKTLLHGLPPLPVEADKSIKRSLHDPMIVGSITMIKGATGIMGPSTTTDRDDANREYFM